MLHNYEVALVVVGNAQIVEERIGRLAHDHGAEELASKPGPAAGSNASLNNRDLEIGALLGEHVCSAQATGSGANDDNVGLGVIVKVRKVATG